ncbi:MAG TPA: hypothetical protein VI381_03275 [Allosphingosinicella sp.]
MWDNIGLETILGCAIAAVIVGGGLGALRRSKTRTTLVTLWTALPVLLVCCVTVITSSDISGLDWRVSLGFADVFILVFFLPWALLTLLPFNLVRRFREIQQWER